MNTSAPRGTSTIARIRDANRDSKNLKEFVTAVLAIIWGSIFVLILKAFIAGLQIAMIVIGALYLNDCPVERFIPIYLVTGGTIGTVKIILGVARKLYENDERPVPTNIERCGAILDCFLAGWFIAGCIWVYGNYLPDFDSSKGAGYCNKTLYYFAFGTVTGTIAIAIFGCLCSTCVVTCVSLKK
ncbi:transmembrane protein 272-like [Ornithodoros turicata]|uniref:transmembrane protein 272-like n=1 Tax=Ornithodoros turicata TaxID=34597 RepID=UPI0031392568